MRMIEVISQQTMVLFLHDLLLLLRLTRSSILKIDSMQSKMSALVDQQLLIL